MKKKKEKSRKKEVMENGRKKQVFLHSFNLPKCIVAGLLMVEWLFSLLFYCECDINQYTGQKT